VRSRVGSALVRRANTRTGAVRRAARARQPAQRVSPDGRRRSRCATSLAPRPRCRPDAGAVGIGEGHPGREENGARVRRHRLTDPREDRSCCAAARDDAARADSDYADPDYADPDYAHSNPDSGSGSLDSDSAGSDLADHGTAAEPAGSGRAERAGRPDRSSSRPCGACSGLTAANGDPAGSRARRQEPRPHRPSGASGPAGGTATTAACPASNRAPAGSAAR
jgi:hypothetical protein